MAFAKQHIPWNKGKNKIDNPSLSNSGVKKGNIPWNKGKTGLTPLNSGMFKPGQFAWNKGKKMEHTVWNKGLYGRTLSSKGKKKESIQKEKHWNWQGGISDKNRQFRNTIEYKKWRMSVFQRDRFSCVLCGYRSVKKRDIRADHIKPFSLFPDLRLNVENGRTLCLSCDLKYGWQLFREKNPRKKSVNEK